MNSNLTPPKSSKWKTAFWIANAIWLIGLLVTTIVILIAIQWSKYPNFVDRLNFAAALASLILAVLAILYAYISNDAITGSVISLKDTASSMSENTGKFAALLESIHGSQTKLTTQVEAINTRMGQSIVPAAAQTTNPVATANAQVIYDYVGEFLRAGSWLGLAMAWTLCVTSRKSKRLDLKEFSAKIGAGHEYLYAYAIALFALRVMAPPTVHSPEQILIDGDSTRFETQVTAIIRDMYANAPVANNLKENAKKLIDQAAQYLGEPTPIS